MPDLVHVTAVEVVGDQRMRPAAGPADRCFSFASAELREVRAHGAESSILTARVLERGTVSSLRFVDLTMVPVGGAIGLHRHDESDEELYVVIEGQARMVVDGESLVIGPGDVVVNRPGGEHALENDGTVPVKLVVIDVAAVRPAERS
jgi:mannose-6-phosphate isomerase-like protein (cupin superfamily)